LIVTHHWLVTPLNNAIEASRLGSSIKISSFCRGPNLVITIEDCGKGIPANILATLMKRGNTHGKENG